MTSQTCSKIGKEDYTGKKSVINGIRNFSTLMVYVIHNTLRPLDSW